METAVRRHLGYQRAGEIEGQLRGFRGLARDVASGKTPVSAMADRSRELLVSLGNATQDLNRLGVTDRSKVELGSAVIEGQDVSSADLAAQKQVLAEAFDAVARQAETGPPEEAASAMTSAYFDAFDPLERRLVARRPQEIRPLEARFNALRGRIGAGLKGEVLVAELASLRNDVSDAIARSQSGGTFGTAFFASLVTILREGVEVILLLTMLITLVAKAGQPKAMAAIRWGVGSAAVASMLTAVGLNLLVVTSQGRAREQIEGWVLMLAAGVLFYVSYWLISQTESKRWTDYLKNQVKRGVAAGGFGTLGLTSFLAVYREGAETALMYQGLIAGQAGSKLGIVGVVAGLLVGLIGLGLIYRIIRSTSIKLPLRTFFKVTGFVLFGMAIVFAGNGVFELQSSGLLKISPIAFLGAGVPWLGLHPNVQVLSVQALLLGGALIALFMPTRLPAEPGSARPSVGEPIREHASV
jgi:high-affinity iron transporter